MNETLEAMARALFKSWFIDFDPVDAKAIGKQPEGLDSATAALFPNSFQDSPLGRIPKGWRVGTVEEVFHFTMGQSPPGDSYNEIGKGSPFYQGCTDFGFRFPKQRVHCTAPTRFAEPGDTLISVRAPVGTLNMATERCSIGRGVAAVRHKSGSRGFTYQSLQSMQDDFQHFEAGGTVFGCMNKQDFAKLRIRIPSVELVLAFEHLARPLDHAVENNESESANLAAARDALLPKLLSGELRA